MSDLLTTKLFVPRHWPDSVERTRLTDQLKKGMDRELTLITAPAGFGKTTLLSEWIPQSECGVAWVSLDKGDNDPTRSSGLTSLPPCKHSAQTSATKPWHCSNPLNRPLSRRS